MKSASMPFSSKTRLMFGDLPSIKKTSGLALLACSIWIGGCGLVDDWLSVKFIEANIVTLEAPAQVKVGTPFDIVVTFAENCSQDDSISTTVDPVSKVVNIKVVQRIQTNIICPLIAYRRQMKTSLHLDQAGQYQLVAGSVRAVVSLTDTPEELQDRYLMRGLL